jgi:hypothetical protein
LGDSIEMVRNEIPEFADGSETKVIAGSNVIVTGTGTITSPYIVNTSYANTHFIGELYGGGIVVYVWKESGVEHGLIASLTDLTIGSAHWSSIDDEYIGQDAISPIDGMSNTNAMIMQGDISGAAYLCDNFSSGGFDDWYLPAVWELNHCYNAAFIVNIILGADDGFKFASSYWSSTEAGDTRSYAFHFDTAYSLSKNKNSFAVVRAVRRF